MYFKAGGQRYCRFNEVRYSEHYLEYTSQQEDIGISAWMKWFRVNIFFGIYFTAGGECYCSIEWSRFKDTLSEIFGPRRLKIYFKRTFLLWSFRRTISRGTYFRMHIFNFTTIPAAKQGQFFIPLFKNSIFTPLHTK